jgi:hypothetical protein
MSSSSHLFARINHVTIAWTTIQLILVLGRNKKDAHPRVRMMETIAFLPTTIIVSLTYVRPEL